MSIEESIRLYSLLSAHQDSFNALFKEKKFKELSVSYLEFRQLQKKAIDMDTEVLNHLRLYPDSADKTLMQELLILMQDVQRKSHTIAAQIKLFTVVQKEELSRLNQGSQLLKKYHSGSSKNRGRRISTCW